MPEYLPGYHRIDPAVFVGTQGHRLDDLLYVEIKGHDYLVFCRPFQAVEDSSLLNVYSIPFKPVLSTPTKPRTWLANSW